MDLGSWSVILGIVFSIITIIFLVFESSSSIKETWNKGIDNFEEMRGIPRFEGGGNLIGWIFGIVGFIAAIITIYLFFA